MKNKKDYVEQIIFGKEEQIKVAIVTLIDQLAHLDFNHKFKKESLNSSLEKRTNDKYKYSKEVIDNEFENQKEMWYNRKTASLDAKHLKELYETISKKEDDLKKKKEQFRLLERSCQKLVQELEYHEKIKEKYKDSLERYNERKEKINEILVIEDKIKGCLSLEEEYNQKEKEILNYEKEVQNLNRIYQNSKEKADVSFQLYIASQFVMD